MSIQDRQRVVELEARVERLERQVADLVNPQRAATERALLTVANQQSNELSAQLKVAKRV